MNGSDSKPNATSVQTETYPTLPPDVILVIIGLLSHEDQQTFLLLSQSFRQLAVPSAFRTLVFSCNIAIQIQRFNEARGDVKAAIRGLLLNDRYYGKSWDYESILFPFLRSLSNLHSFGWNGSFWLRNQGFLQLAASLQHCPLENFIFLGPISDGYVPEDPVTAPSRLKCLSVRGYHAHMYDFIRPSFSTLVELEIRPNSVEFDLLPLKPLGGTLREFTYEVNGFDPAMLEAIPIVFPYLTSLKLVVNNRSQIQVRWENTYDDAIANNTKLQYLAVSASAFTFCDGDPRWYHMGCTKCKINRVEATRALAMACTGLRSCVWTHTNAQFRFGVRLSRKSSEGNTLVRVKVCSVLSGARVMLQPW